MPQNPTTGIDDDEGPQSGAPDADKPNIIHTLGYAANGKPVVQAVGNATTDAAIVAEIGLDAKFADGSLYLSTTAGHFFQKRSDVWTSI